MRSLVLVIAALVFAAPAFAHGGEEPTVHVPLDHVVQGTTFPVVGSDLDATSRVTLRLGDRKLAISPTTDADGHFKAVLAAPEDIEDGYVELSASTDGGKNAKTLVRFCSGAVVAPGTPRGDSGDGFPLLAGVLLTMAAAAAIIGAFLLLRRR